MKCSYFLFESPICSKDFCNFPLQIVTVCPSPAFMKILLIEDEKELLRSIVTYMNKENYVCEAVVTYEEAVEKIDLYQYDCIIVDINLPDGSGLNIISELKKAKSPAGILIISARNSLDDKITGLDIGADDYLTKPFHLPELNARVRSIIRRKNFGGVNEISFNEIRIQPDRMETFVNDQSLTLTKKEFDLLIFFLTHFEEIMMIKEIKVKTECEKPVIIKMNNILAEIMITKKRT